MPRHLYAAIVDRVYGEVLICRDFCMLQQRIGYMVNSLYAATFICCEVDGDIKWLRYMWHSPVVVIATCCKVAYERGVGCNVLGI